MSQRRKLLKSLTVAGAAGAVWTKPVVNSVALPSHASLSCGECIPLSGGAYSFIATNYPAGDVLFYPPGTPCPGRAGFIQQGVVATGFTAAQQAYSNEFGPCNGELSELPGNCNVWSCDGRGQ